MLLLKIWQYCESYPNSLALIVRKEFTDLHDSTMKDFSRYFNTTVSAEKEYKFSNGSVIMFRHAAEIEVLKNINLSIFGIEQAEEFETEEQFTFLRDRLRRDNAPFRQGCIIANANGHNWIWKMWVNNPKEEFSCSFANTFENKDNLPKDFIDDLKRMEVEAPNHYKQYVLNSFEEIGVDDLLFIPQTIYSSPNLSFWSKGTRRLIMAVDVARFGEDKTVFTILHSQNVQQWEMIFQEAKQGWNLMQTTGRILDLKKEFKPSVVVVDDVGVGGGITDRLNELKNPVIAFNGGEKPHNPKYTNRRDEGYFLLKDYFDKGYLKIIDDTDLTEQLLSMKFKYKSNGQKTIVSKDEMRKEGLKSPDKADALMMAIYHCQRTFRREIHQADLPREQETEYAIHEY